MTEPRKKLWQALRFLGSAALLWLLFSRLDMAEFWRLLRTVRWAWMWPPVLLFLVRLTLNSYRWQLILHDLGLSEPLGRLLGWNAFGLFWSNFLPSTLGGDGYRFLQLRREHPGQDAAAFSSIFADRLYGFLALLMVHLFLLPWFWPLVRANPYLLVLELGVVAGVLLLGLLWWQRRRFYAWQERMSARLPGWGRRLQEKVLKILRLLETQRPQTIAWAVGLSAAFVLLVGLALWFYFPALGVWPPLLDVMYASTLAGIVALAPVSLNGLGSMEAAYFLVLATLVPAESILAASFLARGLKLCLALLSGLLYTLGMMFERRQA